MSILPGEARLLLHEVRLRGKVEDPDDDRSRLLGAEGLTESRGGKLVLTRQGRKEHEQWARLVAGSDAERAARSAYEQFLPINTELLKVSTDWQLRNGNIPNTHHDKPYDWGVIDRLENLDERAGPIVRRLGTAIERFAGYRPRLREALKRVKAGENDWFVSPKCDSYHTVWMQLHEDLLLALGLDRASESS
jgi:hypothetical protein